VGSLKPSHGIAHAPEGVGSVIGPELAGAGIFLLGAVCGRYMPARRRHPKPKPDPKPICGCEHHLSYHDPETGHSAGTHRVQAPRPNYDTPAHYLQRPCTCKQYSGPQPMPEFYALEIQP
jgi:hypothetical protein